MMGETPIEELKKVVWRSKLNLGGFPVRHVETDSKFEEGSESKKVLELIKSKIGSGLLLALVGSRGCGKTQISVEVAKTVLNASEGNPVRYLKLVDLMIDIKATWRKSAEQSTDSILNQLKKVKLLVLDEVAEIKGDEWERQLFVNLIDHRYDNKLDTLILGNFKKIEVDQALGASISSRMNECGGIIELKGESFRK